MSKNGISMYDDFEKVKANHVPLSPLSFLPRAASFYPDKEAVVYGNRHYTWAQTYDRCKRLASAINKLSPSLSITFLDSSTLVVTLYIMTAIMTTAGITILLKMALPAVVPTPKAKASASFNQINPIKVVNNSGIELPIALIVAPRTPSDKFLPKYSEAVSNPSLALQITNIEATISNKLIAILF